MAEVEAERSRWCCQMMFAGGHLKLGGGSSSGAVRGAVEGHVDERDRELGAASRRELLLRGLLLLMWLLLGSLGVGGGCVLGKRGVAEGHAEAGLVLEQHHGVRAVDRLGHGARLRGRDAVGALLCRGGADALVALQGLEARHRGVLHEGLQRNQKGRGQ